MEHYIDVNQRSVSPSGLQWFYDEQLHRMECLSQDCVSFEDVMAQMQDMIMPQAGVPDVNTSACVMCSKCLQGTGGYTLQDFNHARSISGILFDVLFNLNKFIAFETRDPFSLRHVRMCNYSHAFLMLSIHDSSAGRCE